MHFIIVLTSLITTHEAQSPIGGGSHSSITTLLDSVLYHYSVGYSAELLRNKLAAE